MQDTAITIARDLIEEVGRTDALRYLAGELAAVRNRQEAMQVLRLMWAVWRG